MGLFLFGRQRALSWMKAVKRGAKAIRRFREQGGTPYDTRDTLERDPGHHAAMKDPATIIAFHEVGGDFFERPDILGRFPCHYVCQGEGVPERLGAYVAAGGRFADIPDVFGNSPRDYAAEQGETVLHMFDALRARQPIGQKAVV